MEIALNPPARSSRPVPRQARDRGLAALIVAALLAVAGGCDRPAPSPGHEPPTAAGPAPAVMSSVPKTPALRPGDMLPPLTAEGWINGPPPSPGAPGVRLLVVDVWALWCPYCRQGAPGLVGVFHKFSGRGVAFVSLTNLWRDTTAQFVEEFGLTWPNGYGATSETIVALGAGSGMLMPGYGVAPTLYLVGPDGKVVWSDEQARFRHAESAKWRQDVERAIETALSKDPASSQ